MMTECHQDLQSCVEAKRAWGEDEEGEVLLRVALVRILAAGQQREEAGGGEGGRGRTKRLQSRQRQVIF